MKITKRQRTSQQNKSLHKMFEEIADEMNAKGITTKTVITIIADTYMTKDLVKNLIWRPIQEAQVGKKSTTQLTTKGIDQVLEPFTLALGKLGISITFPSNL